MPSSRTSGRTARPFRRSLRRRRRASRATRVRREVDERSRHRRIVGVGHPHYEPPEEPWRDVARRSEALLREYADPEVQRICLVDAPAVRGWQEMRRLDERYEGAVLRAVPRSATNRRTIERQALRPLTRMLTAALFECCLTIATAEDAVAAKAESWRVFVRIIDGLRVRTDG